MKFAPIDTGRTVTNKQLGEAINKTHDCIHALADEVRQDRDDGRNRDQKMDVRLARVEGKLGIKEDDKPGKVGLAGVNPWKAFWVVISAMAGLQVTYQLFAPTIVAAATALHQALMK